MASSKLRKLYSIKPGLFAGLILCFGWVLFSACASAHDVTGSSSAASLEVRGVWIQGADFNTPQAADALLERVLAGNFNTLFVRAFSRGEAYYNSQLAERADNISPDFDPLAYLVPRAHRHGLKVYAWLAVGRVASSALNLEPVLTQHSEWAVVDACGTRGEWLNLAHPEARRFIQDLVREIIRNYPVDGIHLDYIRYPGLDWGFDDYSTAAFIKKYDADTANPRQAVLPAYAYFYGTPLVTPGTAQVLATFDNGIPAFLLNEYGAGKVVLFNWNVTRCTVAAANEMMQRSLEELAGEEPQLYLLRRQQAFRDFARVQVWLRDLGWPPEIIQEDDVTSLAADAVVILPNIDRLDPALAQTLANFVKQGGKLIFIQGPFRSMDDMNIQAITGMQGRGRFLGKELWLLPADDHPLLPVTPGKLTWNKQLAQQWNEFRAENVTRLVREVRQSINAEDRKVMFSTAVYRSGDQAALVAQDWPNWLATGIVDFVVPMAYVDDPDELRPLLAEWQNLANFNRVIPGLIVFTGRGQNIQNKSPEQMLAEIKLVRTGGARGVVLFAMDRIDNTVLQILGNGPFASATESTP